MAEYTSNYNLEKQQGNEYVNIDGLNTNFDKIDSALGNSAKFEKAGGTATVITLTGIILEDGACKTFIVSANNNSVSTTINGKKLYKTNMTTAPSLIAGKAVTVWYDATSDCFFIKASAEGTATADKVLAGETFSNEEDTGIIGTMPNNGTVNITLSSESAEYTVPKGYHNGLGKVKAVITGLVAGVIKAGTTVGGIFGTFTSDATATASQMLSGVIAYVNGVKVTGTMPNKGAVVITPGTTNQAITQGYHNGAGYVAGDPDFVASNILSTANIFGLQGIAVAGKRFASGVANLSSSYSATNAFTAIDGHVYGATTLTVSGLTFTPSIIFVRLSADYGQSGFTIYHKDGIFNDGGAYSGSLPGYVGTVNAKVKDTVALYNVICASGHSVHSTGFYIPVASSLNKQVTWYAYE